MPLTLLEPTAALVVVDLLKMLGGSPPIAEVVDRSARLADAFRAHGLPVLLVRVTAEADGSGFAPGRTEAATSLAGRPPGWDEIVDELAGHPEDVVVTKRNPGAFYGTDLEMHLRRRGVTQVVLTGVATSLGVEATARAAYDHGFHVVPVVDAMLGPTPAAHEHSVTVIFPTIGETATTDEVPAALKEL